MLPILSILKETAAPQDSDGVHNLLEILDRETKARIQKVQEQTDEITKVVKDVRKDVGQFQATIKSEKARVDQTIVRYQQQFSEAQDLRQQNFHEAEKQRTSKFDSEVMPWREKFSTLEREQKTQFNTFISLIDNNQKVSIDKAEKSVSQLLKDIEERRDKAKEIVQIIAGTGMAGGYQKDANAQQWAFRLWNILTIVGFAGLIGFAIWLFADSTGESFAWPRTVSRFITILAFGLLATYAGRMAMQHRVSERQHRHKQLALESVNAFLEDLTPEVQKEVKQKMADAFFMQPQSLPDTGQDVAPSTIESLLKLLSVAISKLK